MAAATTRSTDAPGTPAAEDPTLDRISVRVPADLPLAVVNLSLTRLAQWHGGSVFGAAELRRTVEMVCGIDSVRTTLFALRSDRGLRRRVGEIAIVLYASDLSSWNQRLLRRFTSLSQPLTLSVLPDADHLDDIVALARRHGHELMLHLPMEPEDYPARDPGEGTLLVEHDDETISRLLRDHLRRLPAAVGVSNYMGSRATADSRVMGEVLRTLKKRRLFFLDSRTTPLSLGLLMATELEVPAAARDVVLDGGEGATPAAVEERLWELADLATRRGYAIGVADDSEQTLRALESMLPRLESRGYRFVRVSQLAR